MSRAAVTSQLSQKLDAVKSSVVSANRSKRFRLTPEVVKQLDMAASRLMRASLKSAENDPLTQAVAEFHDALGVKNPDKALFPEKKKQCHAELREIISYQREVAAVSKMSAKNAKHRDLLMDRAVALSESLYLLFEALAKRDEVHVSEKSAEMVYSVLETMLMLGLGRYFMGAFEEVHLSKMSAIDPATGSFILDRDGNIKKGPHYRRPNIRRVINAADTKRVP